MSQRCYVDEWGHHYYISDEDFEEWCKRHTSLIEWIHEVDAITLENIDDVEEALGFIKQCDE